MRRRKIIKIPIYILTVIFICSIFSNAEYVKGASAGYHDVTHTWNHTSKNGSSDCGGCTAVEGKTNCGTCPNASGKVLCTATSTSQYETVSVYCGACSKTHSLQLTVSKCSKSCGLDYKVIFSSECNKNYAAGRTYSGYNNVTTHQNVTCTTCGGDGALNTTCTRCNGKGWNYKCTNTNCAQNYDAKWDHWTTESGYNPVCYAAPNTYSVKYNGNGNTGGSMSNSSHTYDTAKALTGNGFTKNGYTFAGWATSSTGAVAYGNGASVKNLTTTNNGTVNLYAKWNAITYSVKYNANGGSGTMSNSSHTYDTAKTLTTNTFTRTGYTFLGWSTSSTATTATYADAASVKNLTATNGGTVNLYAVWQAHTYDVVYNANDGSGTMSNSNHTYDSAKTLTANAFTRVGYTFLGWSTISTSTSATYTNQQSVKNLTATKNGTVNLYAIWKANTYTITYDGNGATSGSMNKSTHTYDTDKNLTANAFVKDGYEFAGWSTSYNATSVTYTDKQSVKNLKSAQDDNITLYAIWKRIEKTVTYNANGGTLENGKATDTKNYYINDAVNLELIANKTGFTFIGWALHPTDGGVLENYNMPNENVTLYARYTIPVSGLAPKAFFAVWNPSNTSKRHQFDVPVNRETKNGYVYAISGLNATTSALGVNVEGAFFVYDNANNYSATTFTNSGTPNDNPIIPTIPNIYKQTTVFKFYDIAASDYTVVTLEEDVVEGVTYKPLTLPTTLNGVEYKLPDGYFGGVSFSSTTGNTSASATYVVSKEETHTYVYQPKDYIVTLDANGGKHENGNGTISHIVTYSGYYGSLPTPTREGYTFLGWYTEKSVSSGTTNGTRISATDLYETTSNTTLYAAWKVNSYNIVFDYGTNGGVNTHNEATKTVAVNYGATVTPNLLVENGVRDGWEFVGWSKNPASKTNDASFTMSVPSNGDSIMLFAIYKKTYTYTFKDRVGDQVVSCTLYNKDTFGEITTPNIRDFAEWTALGWTTKADASEQYEKAQGTSFEMFDTSPATTTYYAVYKKHISVNFEVTDDCNVIESIEKDLYYNTKGNETKLTFTAPIPSERKDYSFVKWICSNGNEYVYTNGQANNWTITTSDSLTFTSVWNAYPKLYVNNHYYTLNSAVAGEITSEDLLKDALATDEEDGDITDINKLYIVNFDPSEYTSLTCGAEFSITYRVVDNFGHIIEKEALVYITDTATRKDTHVTASRFIEERYLSGLAEKSIWKTNLVYKTALSNALTNRSEKTSLEGMKYTFSITDLKAMKEYVKTNGFSDIENENGRFGFKNLFIKNYEG